MTIITRADYLRIQITKDFDNLIKTVEDFNRTSPFGIEKYTMEYLTKLLHSEIILKNLRKDLC